jgi:predicted RNase H-like HicB family nuclease
MDFTIVVHEEGAEFWSEVEELPGCFASGRTLTELRDAAGEAVGLYVWDAPADAEGAALEVGRNQRTVRPALP